MESCDAAAERIQQTVSEQLAAGTEDVDGMSFDAGLEPLGVYKAYLADVRDGACPPDVLGNDEFGFIGAR